MTFCLRGVGPVKADVTLFPMELPELVASCLLSARHQDPIPLQKIIAGGVRAFAHVDIDSAGDITVANFAGAAPGLGGTNCVVAFNFSFFL